MILQFQIGTPLNVRWHFKKPNGDIFSLAGYSFKLSCFNGRGHIAINTITYNSQDGYISFILPPDKQSVGIYSFSVELYMNGGKANSVIYADAVQLVDRIYSDSTGQMADANNNTINIFSVGEYNLFQPEVVVPGSDGYWYYNGQIIEDGQGNPVPTHIKVAIADNGTLTFYKGVIGEDDYEVVATFLGVKSAIDKVDAQFVSTTQGTWANKIASIVSAEAARVSAENGRVTSETVRTNNESTRISRETTRQSNETERISAEITRGSNEDVRISNESSRESLETQRQDSENQRISNETTRGNNEQSRQIAESLRAYNETARQQAEGSIDDESGRAYAEFLRQQAEGSVASESGRAYAEYVRQQQEELRKNTFNLNEGTAVEAPRADGSRWARFLYSQNQRQQTFNEDHNRAESDHNTASTDHTRAGSDHNYADFDHNRAATDHTTADADHTRANTDHNTADTDHNTAAADHEGAVNDSLAASADHLQAGQDHATASEDHTTSAELIAELQNYDDHLDTLDSKVGNIENCGLVVVEGLLCHQYIV